MDTSERVFCSAKVLIFFSLFLFSSSFSQGEEGGPDTRFSASLGKEVSLVQKEILLSPMSLYRTMALLSLGAEGRTREELQNFLHFSHDDRLLSFLVRETRLLYPEVKSASGVFSSPFVGLRQEFIERVKGFCPDATFQSCDFNHNPEGSCAFINKWISDRTLGRIPHILSPNDIDRDTVSAVVNALSFQASWRSPFDKENTKKAFFFSPQGEKEVSMMEKEERVVSFKENGLSYVELEYKPEGEGHFVLELLMSTDTSQNPLQLFERARERKARHYVHLKVPKMKLKQRTLLTEPLKNMGLQDCFSRNANFSRIAMLPLYIQKVIQQVDLEVYEEGTEGAAATVAVIGVTSYQPPVSMEEITFDHPFWLILREKKTGSVIFYSYVTSP